MNSNLKEEIEKLCFLYRKQTEVSIKQLQESGSPRKYFRISFPDMHTIIAAYSENIRENETFVYFSKVFATLPLNTPKVLAVNERSTVYLMEDVGNTCLLDVFSKSETEKLSLAKQALDYLIVFQTEGVKHIDFSKCYQKQIFDKELIFWDLNYFKYYFLKLEIDALNESALEADFRVLSEYLTAIPNSYFMYRDFQSRNIQVNNGKLYFIDYQGGMQGPLQYDLASLIYQAKANFSESERKSLIDYYLQMVSKKISVNDKLFKEQFYVIVLLRVLQTLGAYGFRGLIEGKSHFITSIAPALQNLKQLLPNVIDSLPLPYLSSVLQTITSESVIKKYKNMNKLHLSITSFSYKKGIPTDISGNGGGFVFDCRALPNPGKLDEYKQLTGRDIPVIEYLDKMPEVDEFLELVYAMVTKSVQTYIARGFTHLMVNFGCTGGQHRSVYCAEHLNTYIKKHFEITTSLKHVEQDK